jgi:hypothetical protein
MIWLALIIPFITGAILYIFFKKDLHWVEYGVLFLASLLVVVIAHFCVQSKAYTNEFWGSVVTEARYYEEWNEYIHQTCSTCVSHDKNGNCTSEIHYDCSYVETHSPYWELSTTIGENYSISEEYYNYLVKLFGNKMFVEMNRHYYTKDGNMYKTSWDNSFERCYPITSIHTYKNKIKVADASVFHFEEIDDSTKAYYNLKDYPSVDALQQIAIIGDDSSDWIINNSKLMRYNGILGPKKQVKIFILIFKNQPIEAGNYQEWYWSGGNMNEFICAIGIDNQRVIRWNKVISWTTSEKLKADVNQFITAQGSLKLDTLVDYVATKVDSEYVRRDFSEFDYLSVQPKNSTIFIVYLICIGMCFGVSYWSVTNDIYEESILGI